MTLHNIASQLHSLSDGRINGEHFTKAELERALQMWMRNSERNAIKNAFVLEIVLRDGAWLAEVTRFADSPDGFDYWIPDTREQEARLYEALLG